MLSYESTKDLLAKGDKSCHLPFVFAEFTLKGGLNRKTYAYSVKINHYLFSSLKKFQCWGFFENLLSIHMHIKSLLQ